MASYDLHIINPRKKTKKTTRTKKKTSKKRATNMAGKKRTKKRRRNPAPPKRRRRRAAPVAAAAPRRRRRRASNPAPKRRRRRTSNPTFGLAQVQTQLKRFVPRLAGKLAVAFVVKKIGYTGSTWGGSDSAFGGEAWSWKQYTGAILMAMFGGRLMGKFVSGTEFADGAWDAILTRAIWTDGIARSPWAVEQFGDGQVAIAPSTGQSWINQGGQYVNMQGGTLVEASALDGGTLVEASAMDGGTLVEAGAMDGNEVYPGEVYPVSGYAQSYDSSATYGS